MTDTYRAPRADLIAEVLRMAEGWDHLGHPERVGAALQAAELLRSGSPSVRVGHTVYHVTPDTRRE